jgi:predicted O-linked N-acetylglucosamine transferase (SPINDLY family)
MPIPPQERRARYQQAVSLANAGRSLEAEAAYRDLLARAPDTWAAAYNLGLLLQAREAFADAEQAYRSAIAHNAQLAEAHNNLGNVLTRLGRAKEAIDCFRRALQRNPALTQAAFNLAAALQNAGQFDSAIASYRQVTSRIPHETAAWDGLWRSQLAAGKSADAATTFLQWQDQAPVSPELVLAGLNSARALADSTLERRYVDLAIRWPFAHAPAATLSPVLGLLQYFDIAPTDLLTAYQRYDALAARANAVHAAAERAPSARLRIGYVSGDFRSHVMGRLMWEVFSRHDRTQFDWTLFSLSVPRETDPLTTSFREWANAFVDLSRLNDASAAREIAALGIDVLVDLGGHTMSARPDIYLHRPAPHLLTHLGYHGALGLSFCEGKISDGIADPPGNEAWQVEPPRRLDACVFPLVAGEPCAAELEPPAALDGAFVFAQFVNVLKLSPRCAKAWRAVLDALPSARLMLSPFAKGDRAVLAHALTAHGIDAARLVFLEVSADDPRLPARYRLAHAVMDTFPYGGGDTTLAALSQGVPVVSLVGQRHAERIGASMLTHAGVPELIAATEREFIECAIRLALDEPWRRELSARLKAAFANADTHLTRHVRELERVYRAVTARRSTEVA